jgi:hypothetical protein
LLKIEGKTGKHLVKVWDKKWSKLLKILTILKLLLRLHEKIGNFAHVCRKILNLLMLVRQNFFDNASVSPEKCF